MPFRNLPFQFVFMLKVMIAQYYGSGVECGRFSIQIQQVAADLSYSYWLTQPQMKTGCSKCFEYSLYVYRQFLPGIHIHTISQLPH